MKTLNISHLHWKKFFSNYVKFSVCRIMRLHSNAISFRSNPNVPATENLLSAIITVSEWFLNGPRWQNWCHSCAVDTRWTWQRHKWWLWNDGGNLFCCQLNLTINKQNLHGRRRNIQKNYCNSTTKCKHLWCQPTLPHTWIIETQVLTTACDKLQPTWLQFKTPTKNLCTMSVW